MQEPNSKRMQELNSNSVSLFSLLTHLLAVLFGSAICWLILRHIGSLEKKLVEMEATQQGKEQTSKEILALMDLPWCPQDIVFHPIPNK